jgi:Fe-S oxidoreductase
MSEIHTQLHLKKHIAELDNCTYCPKLCRFSCPVAVADGSETLTPRQLMLTVNLHRENKLPLNASTAKKLWSCVDCRGCQSFCDHHNDVATTLQETRAQLVASNVAPEYVNHLIATFQATGFLPDRSRQGHAANALPQSTQAETVLFIGCQQDTEGAQQAYAKAQELCGELQVAPPMCCGQPLQRLGARQAYEEHQQKILLHLAKAKHIIVDDPGCAFFLKQILPEVKTLKAVRENASNLPRHEAVRAALEPPLAPPASQGEEHSEGGRSQAEAEQLSSQAKLEQPAHHASCYETRWLKEPAEISDSIYGNAAGCCGGMLLPFYDQELAQKTAEQRVQDLLAGGKTQIVTSSPTCKRRLQTVHKNTVYRV